MHKLSLRPLGWLLLVCLTGCSGQLHQYLDVQAHPAQVANQVASRAYEKGYEIGPMRADPRLGFDLYQIHWMTEEESPDTEPPTDDLDQADLPAPAAVDPAQPAQVASAESVPEPTAEGAAAAPPGDKEGDEPVEGVDYTRLQVAEVEFYPTATGNRLAARTDFLSSSQLADLLPDEPTLRYRITPNANPITETISWELVGNLGYRWAQTGSEGMQALDLDTSARIGGRLLRFGGGGETPAGMFALGLMAGVGLGLGSEGFEFRPSVFISLDHQETVKPVPGEVLAVGQKLSVDLGVQGMIGSEVRGLTGRLELRFAEIAGLYMAAGYQFAPEASPVVTFGLSLGTMPVAGIGLLYLLAL